MWLEWFISWVGERICQMFVLKSLQLWTWQPCSLILPPFLLISAAYRNITLKPHCMVPCGGRFILKVWKAICFRFSGITSDIAPEHFQFGKLVSHHRPECSNIGKLFEWKMLSLWSCQGGTTFLFRNTAEINCKLKININCKVKDEYEYDLDVICTPENC